MLADNVKKELGVIISRIVFKCGYQEFLGNTNKKAIVVEGYTDEKLISRIKKRDVLSIQIKEICTNRSIFLGKEKGKNAIVYLFQVLPNDPDIEIAPGCGKWSLYGLVDRDYDDEMLNLRLPRLFITDTHDIETLIFSTDNQVTNRLSKASISPETMKKALFLSYQLLCYRQVLRRLPDKNHEIDIKALASQDTTIDFSAFVDGNNIVPDKLLKTIFSNQNKNLSNEKKKKLVDNILKDKQMKKHFDNKGEWKYQMETFSPEQVNSYWLIVRGHDIVSAICSYDTNARNVYFRNDSHTLNREFEKDLIDAYDIGMFKKTELYRQMKAADLVVD